MIGTKHIKWFMIYIILLLILFVLCIIYINGIPIKYEFIMDDNTLKAIQTINWSVI